MKNKMVASINLLVKFATCDMCVVFESQRKVSLELKRRVRTKSTVVHLLVSVTAIIKFGLEPMDPILKKRWMCGRIQKNVENKIQLSANCLRDDTRHDE